MREPALAEKTAFLSSPAAYASGTERVEVKETHMSFVFLTDRHAWKLKKPAREEYLDFSTVAARKVNCEREVKLNRRLAPEVYLGTVPLVMDAQGGMQIGGDGRVIDWLVQMRRLPEDRMLDRAVKAGTASPEEVRAVGDLLAGFYKRAERIGWSPAEYEMRLRATTQECARELRRLEYALPAGVIESIYAEQMDFLEREAALFAGRALAGRIVDAHGDLRPEHICLGPEPAILDCLEFNAELRALDPVSELAFLCLECERLDAPWVGESILDTYQRETGDRPPKTLLEYYRRQHALVRAKIAVWHLKEPGVVNPGKWTGRAKEYLFRAGSLEEIYN